VVNSFEWMLLEFLVAATGPLAAADVSPQVAVAALVVTVTLIALAVVLLHMIGVLRFPPASRVRSVPREAADQKSRTVRGPVRARAPSVDREPARA
jgi:hypothetical protein